MNVINDLFDYGLKIYQNSDYFKFSIDSILLGEFVKLKSNSKVLDMCTGNAPIPLILTTKNKNLNIDAVELQKEIYFLGKESVAVNQLDNIIKVFNDDIRTIELEDKYDIIVCNPPYFKVDTTSKKNENKIKRIARHEICLTLEDVISCTSKHLKENGHFYMVHRTERFLNTIKLLENAKFGIRDIAFIYTKKNKPAEFFLIEASKCKKSDIKVRSFDITELKTYKNIFKEV